MIATGFDDRRHAHAEPSHDAWHRDDEPQQPQTSRWDDERPAYREPAQQPLASSSSSANSDPRTRNVFADLPDFEHDTELPAFLRRNVTAR